MGKTRTMRDRSSYNHPKEVDFTSAKHKGCGKKIKFVSERQACIEAQKQIILTGMEFRPYRCDFCRCWHISKSQKLE